jgi:hypothetical protein
LTLLLRRGLPALQALQLLLELLIAVLKLLDLPGQHAHLLLDLLEPHDDVGARHLRRSRRRAGKRDQQGERKNFTHGSPALLAIDDAVIA